MDIEKKLKDLKTYDKADRIVHAKERKAILDEEKANKPKFPIISAFPTLDERLNGDFKLGTVNVISGPTGEGKTTLMQTLTKSFVAQDILPVWFPYEGIPEEFFDKFGSEIPHFYLPREIPENGNTLAWLKDRILEAKTKFNIKAVFIDHLHYFREMQGVSGTDQLSLYIGDIMRALAKFAGQAQVVIFLVVHVKSDAGTVNSRHIFYTKDDIRDSSFVKQEADRVMMIYRGRKKTDLNDAGWEYTDNAIINLDKNRHGGKVGFVKLIHRGGFFEEFEMKPIMKPILKREEDEEIDVEQIKF